MEKNNIEYNETQRALINHLKKGKRAIREAERLYSLLNEISSISNKYKAELGHVFTYIEKVYSKKDNGEILSDGKNIYWRSHE